MGTWDTGPFDNDSAADFAGDIRGCSGPEARHDLLLATLRAGTEVLSRTQLKSEESYGYELEHAVAAAAFVADEHTHRKDFTNTSFARGVGDDMELKPYVDFLPPSQDLLLAARKFTNRLVNRMSGSWIGAEWITPIKDIESALFGPKGDG